MAVKKQSARRKKSPGDKKSGSRKKTSAATATRRRGAPVKFPRATDYPESEPAVMCSAARVLKLYNENSGDTAQRFSQKVRDWFAKEAFKLGWAGAHFVKDVQSRHGSGCILHRPPPNIGGTITVEKTTLILT